MILAIKGHKTRGGEVIQLLEMLGGDNNYSRYCGYNTNANTIYYIDSSDRNFIKMIEKPSNNSDFIVFTIEEFEEKFPYKVGDKVKAWINGYCSICNIRDMEWDSIVNEIKYKIQDYWYSTMNLQPYKEEGVNLQELERKLDEALAKETTESLNKWLDGEPEPEPKAPILSNRYDYAEGKCGYVIPDGYEFDYIKEGFQTEIILKPKKPQYPKTYEECCDVIGISRHDVEIDLPHPYQQKMFNLFKLHICRDAYWKLAGKEMGFDKPWEPDFTNIDNCYLAIKTCKGEISLISTLYIEDCILAFPTPEMRDAFYENFKDLIEQCKELL